MYATKLINEIYHLMPPNGNYTLCGLRVSRLSVDTRFAGYLQLVDKVPPGKTMCKHCERIRSQTEWNGPA